MSMLRQRAGFVTAATAAFIIGIGGLAVSANTDDTTVYTACVNESSGALRLIDPTKASDAMRNACTSRERQISWNAQGPAGPAGPSGISVLAGQRCTAGQVLVGFTSEGGLDCAPSGDLGGGDTDDGVDNDGDGIPDAQDLCPETAQVIRDGIAYDCSTTLTHLLTGVVTEGSHVWIRNLKVTAVNGAIVTLTDAGNADYDGEDTSVIDIDFTGFDAPEINSRVTLYGVVAVNGEGNPVSLQLGYVDLLAGS